MSFIHPFFLSIRACAFSCNPAFFFPYRLSVFIIYRKSVFIICALLVLINRRRSSVFSHADRTHRDFFSLFICPICNDPSIIIPDIGHTGGFICKAYNISSLIQYLQFSCVDILPQPSLALLLL